MDLGAQDMSDMDPTEPDERFAKDVEEQVVRQLRENHPWTDVSTITAIASSCHNMIVNGVKEQLPMIKQSRSRSGFLNLPAEIRNQIYELIVVDDEVKLCGLGPRASEWKDVIRQPALAKTCCQLREEVLSLFYTANKFKFNFRDHLVEIIYYDLNYGLQPEEIVRKRTTNISGSDLNAVFAWLKPICAHYVRKIGHLNVSLLHTHGGWMPLRQLEANRIGVQQVLQLCGEEMAFTLPPILTLEKFVVLERREVHKQEEGWVTTTLEFPSDSRLAHERHSLEHKAGLAGIADRTHSVADDSPEDVVGEAGATSCGGDAKYSERLSLASVDKAHKGQ